MFYNIVIFVLPESRLRDAIKNSLPIFHTARNLDLHDPTDKMLTPTSTLWELSSAQSHFERQALTISKLKYSKEG